VAVDQQWQWIDSGSGWVAVSGWLGCWNGADWSIIERVVVVVFRLQEQVGCVAVD
jgi:hypothetical protein